METVKNLVADGSGFMKDQNGTLMVKQEYIEPVVVANIGKQNKWLSLRPVILSTTEEGVTASLPGVSIEISSTNGYASTLTVEEFLTVYTIIKDIDLASIQAQMSLAFLMTDDGMPQMQQQMGYGYQQPQVPQYQRQYQQPQGQTVPKYNNPQRQTQQRRTSEQQVPQYQKPSNLPPRETSSTLNFQSIEDTPVSEVDYDDSETIDEIFNDD